MQGKCSTVELKAFLLLKVFEVGGQGLPYGDQTGLELPTILPQPPKCWDYWCGPCF